MSRGHVERDDEDDFDWRDYLSDEEDSSVVEKGKPVLNEDVSMYVVADGFPVVGQDKYDKLLGVLKTLFARFNGDFEGDIWMPTAGTPPQTKGYERLSCSYLDISCAILITKNH
jgi:hypothetical protein